MRVVARPTFVGLFLVASFSNVAWGAHANVLATSLRLKQFLQAEPATVLHASADSDEVPQGLESSCAREEGFERTFDKLAYDLFAKDGMNESPEVTYVRQLLDSVALGAGAHKVSLNLTASVPLNAATARLQSWWNATMRVHRNMDDGSHSNRVKLMKRDKSKWWPTGLVPNGSDGVPDTEVDHDANAKAKVTHAKASHSKVLPTACAASLPANDPYWSQKDSYWVCNGGKCDAYNDCKYSDGCKREFTNGERVASLRSLLATTHLFLNKLGVTYMLFGGSVIGAYRCKDVLPWDLDTDVAVLTDHIPRLINLLQGAAYGTGFRGHGRSIDLAPHGFPGFSLAEKQTGCIPVAIVDHSTGFFTDVFPMKPGHHGHAAVMWSPWWTGKVACNGAELFNGCPSGRCDYWSYMNTLPPSPCQVHTSQLACARDMYAFVHEYYGPSVDAPDKAVRPGAAAVLMDETTQPHSSWISVLDSLGGSIYFVMTALVFLIPLVLWLSGLPLVWVILTFYLGLYMAWAMLTYATREQRYTSGMLVLNALLFKLAISLLLWRSWEGTSFIHLPRVAWEARSTMLQYVVPAGLYACSDIIRVNALRATDASTFAILFNSRMLFLAFLWQWIMNRKLHLVHWVSLIAILVGCCLKEFPHVEAGPEVGSSRRHWAYFEIALLGVITCFATVWNEMLLQKRSDVGVSLQNLAMYVWGTIWTLIILVVWMIVDPTQLISPFNVEAWRAIWGQPLVLMSGVVMALYGVATAYFLRYLSNITREVTLGAFAPLLSVAMDYFLFKLILVPIEYVGLMFVLIGVVVFAFQPVLAIDAEKQELMEESVDKKDAPNSARAVGQK